MSWHWACVVGVALMLCVRRAAAEPRVVVLTVSSGGESTGAQTPTTPAAVEQVASTDALQAQMLAELGAAGFATIAFRLTEPATLDALERAAQQTGSVATIAISKLADRILADVWVTDAVLRKTVVRRVEVEEQHPDAPRILAIRSVEVLHAGMTELNLELPPELAKRAEPGTEGSTQNPPVGSVSPAATRDRPEGQRRQPIEASPVATKKNVYRVAVSVGAGVLGGPGDIPVSFPVPLARATWRFAHPFGLELSWLGPARSSTTVSSGPNQLGADVDEMIAMLRVRFDPSSQGWVLEPFASGGLAGAWISAKGELLRSTVSTPELRATKQSAFVALATLGAGLRWRPWTAFGLLATVDGALAFSRPVLLLDRVVAKTAQPVLVGAVGAEAFW